MLRILKISCQIIALGFGVLLVLFTVFDAWQMLTHYDYALDMAKMTKSLNSTNQSPSSAQFGTVSKAQDFNNSDYQELRRTFKPREPRIESFVFDASMLCFAFSAILWFKKPDSPLIQLMYG